MWKVGQYQGKSLYQVRAKSNNSRTQRWRNKHVSLNLVRSHRTYFWSHRKIGDACAHDHFLDDRARHHWIDLRGRPYPYVLTPDQPAISSRRPAFFHSGSNPDSLHLLQAEHPFPYAEPRISIKVETPSGQTGGLKIEVVAHGSAVCAIMMLSNKCPHPKP